MHMRATKVHRILKALGEGLRTTDKILDACLGNYGRMYRDARKSVLGAQWPDWEARNDPKDYGPSPAERERFYKILSYLKREGLIEKRKDKKEWELTKRGLEKLESSKEKHKFSLASFEYSPVEDIIL
ncbi:MAG: hypothetical protein Q8R20_01315, partial [Nanoarchaeota archaeon]|nr:hypothetical protein [Nanoarchaeota archaeon]